MSVSTCSEWEWAVSCCDDLTTSTAIRYRFGLPVSYERLIDLWMDACATLMARSNWLQNHLDLGGGTGVWVFRSFALAVEDFAALSALLRTVGIAPATSRLQAKLSKPYMALLARFIHTPIGWTHRRMLIGLSKLFVTMPVLKLWAWEFDNVVIYWHYQYRAPA